MARNKMNAVYVGDVGEIFQLNPVREIPKFELEDLETMDIHQLFALALECGIKVQQLIGIEKCSEHWNMVLLKGVLPQGFTMIEDTKFCTNCYQMFRYKTKLGI